jgi:adenylate kinase
MRMALYIILLGVQGAGKGVQASFIQSQYNIPHISTGDLFRAMKSRTDDLAVKIQEIMKEGRLVSDEVTCEVVQDRLEQPDAKNGVILDGFPRNPVQADWLENYLAQKGEAVSSVLLFDLDLYVAFKRAFGRVSNAEGKTYNIFSNADGIQWSFSNHPENEYPPRLEAVETATNTPLERRPDDANAGSIIKRIDTYLEVTMPLIEYYREKGLLKTLDASRDIETVSADVKAVIDALR